MIYSRNGSFEAEEWKRSLERKLFRSGSFEERKRGAGNASRSGCSSAESRSETRLAATQRMRVHRVEQQRSGLAAPNSHEVSTHRTWFGGIWEPLGVTCTFFSGAVVSSFLLKVCKQMGPIEWYT